MGIAPHPAALRSAMDQQHHRFGGRHLSRQLRRLHCVPLQRCALHLQLHFLSCEAPSPLLMLPVLIVCLIVISVILLYKCHKGAHSVNRLTGVLKYLTEPLPDRAWPPV